MSTLKQLHRQTKSRRQGKPAFTLLELIVVLLVLGILAAIAVPTFNRVKENSVQRVAQTTLEAAARNGEAIARSNGDATDEQIAAAVESEFTDANGLTVTVSGDTVTVTQAKGSITASGSVQFNGGDATITDATTGSSSGPAADAHLTNLVDSSVDTGSASQGPFFASMEYVLFNGWYPWFGANKSVVDPALLDTWTVAVYLQTGPSAWNHLETVTLDATTSGSILTWSSVDYMVPVGMYPANDATTSDNSGVAPMPTCALPSIGDDCGGSTFGDFKVVIRGYDGSDNLLGGETVATFSIASGPFESLSNFTVVKGAL